MGRDVGKPVVMKESHMESGIKHMGGAKTTVGN